jgi:hypothetical protein
MLNLGRGEETFVVILACLLGFVGKFGEDAVAHVVGFTFAPLDHTGIGSIGGAMFRDDLENYLIMHVCSLSISQKGEFLAEFRCEGV